MSDSETCKIIEKTASFSPYRQKTHNDPANKGNLYYRCTDILSKYPLPRVCFEHGINAPVLDALVWDNIKSLFLNPQLVIQQAQRWQKSSSPLEAQVVTLKKRLKALDDEERRYTKAYGQGVLSERLYKDNFHETNTKRADIVSEISAIEAELVNKPVIPVEQLVDGVIKLVQSLDFTDKKSVIRKLVTKIEATKQEITIRGRIPIPATGQVGYYANDSDSHFTTQLSNALENSAKVGLDVNNRYDEFITQLPFELKLTMPPTDKGGRGYSNKLVAQLHQGLASDT